MEYIIDIETDDLLPFTSRVWCIGIKELNKPVKVYRTDDIQFPRTRGDGIYNILLDPRNTVIGHNLIGFDLRVLKKLWNIEHTCKVYDTLVWSRLLYPDRRGGHSLDSWGQRFNYPKLEFKDFSGFSPEMARYCARDVELNELVYNRLIEEMNR